VAYIQLGPRVLTQAQREQIERALSSIGAFAPCARCQYSEFAVLDTIFTNNPGPMLAGASVQSFPTVGVVCTHCGVVYYHLLGVLGKLGDFGLV